MKCIWGDGVAASFVTLLLIITPRCLVAAEKSPNAQLIELEPFYPQTDAGTKERFLTEAHKGRLDLDRIITKQVKRAKIPSLSAVVVRDGEIVWSNAYGFADAFARPPVRASVDNTSYLLASISKTVTGVTLMRLYEQGKFKLDDDINTYLLQAPQNARFTVRHPRFEGVPITFRMLMTHTSSISDDPMWDIPLKKIYTRDGDSNISLRQFLFDYFHPNGAYYSKRRFTKSRPGRGYEYSNIGATLVAYLVEILSGRDFAEVSEELTLRPAGMSESGTSWNLEHFIKKSSSGSLSDSVAMPTVWKKRKYKAYCHYTFPDYPDGGLRATATDLARFMLNFMQGGGAMLKESTVKEMMRVQNELPGAAKEDQGLMWYYKKLGSRRLIGHNGGEMGTTTDMFFDPETNVGVILLSNGEGNRKYDKAFDKIETSLFNYFTPKGRRLETDDFKQAVSEKESSQVSDRRALQRALLQSKASRLVVQQQDLCRF